MIFKLHLNDYLLTLPVNNIRLAHKIWVYQRTFMHPKAQKLVSNTGKVTAGEKHCHLAKNWVTHL